MTPHLDPPPADLALRGRVRRTSEIDVGTVPPPGRAAAGSPPRFRGLAGSVFPLTLRQRPRRSDTDVARPGSPGAVRCGVWWDGFPLLGAGRGSFAAASPPGQRPGGGREGPDRGRPRAGPSSALAASLTIRLLVTQASRFESLRGSGNINLSTNARGDDGPSCRGRGRVPRSRRWVARNVARRRGPRHRREV